MKAIFLTIPVLALALIAGDAGAQGLGVGNNITGSVSGATDRVTGNLDAGASAGARSTNNGGGISIDLGAKAATNGEAGSGNTNGASATTRTGVNTRAGEKGSTSGTDITTGVNADTHADGAPLPLRPRNMNAEQFSAYAAGRWDANGDGVINNTEWRAINSAWFNARTDTDFRIWDRNSNGTLDSAEAKAMVSSSGMYRVYDANNDGRIDETEAGKLPAE